MLRDSDLAFMRRMDDKAAPAAEEPVTFYRYSSVERGNRAAGKSDTIVYDPPEGIPITAVVIPASLETKDEPGGRVESGDVTFQIRYSVLPPTSTDANAGTTGASEPETTGPGPNDRIEWKGALYKPIKVTSPQLIGTLVWIVRGERL